MRLRNFLIAVAVLALAVPGFAQAESGFKVTGGGQIITDEQEAAGGPGDTVGFVAQEMAGDDEASPGDDDDAARGQFQYNPHGGANAQNQPAEEKFHGVVTCLISGGEAVANENAEGDEYEEELVNGMARFGGYVRGQVDENGDPIYFTVDVKDNGQGGGPEAEDDLILVRMTDAPCADNPEDEEGENQQDLFDLGRGNVKIHNYPTERDTEEPPADPAALLAGLARR